MASDCARPSPAAAAPLPCPPPRPLLHSLCFPLPACAAPLPCTPPTMLSRSMSRPPVSLPACLRRAAPLLHPPSASSACVSLALPALLCTLRLSRSACPPVHPAHPSAGTGGHSLCVPAAGTVTPALALALTALEGGPRARRRTRSSSRAFSTTALARQPPSPLKTWPPSLRQEDQEFESKQIIELMLSHSGRMARAMKVTPP
jgi:hypothetical protein